MVDGHDRRRGNQHPPVAIERQHRQRTEHVKMRFDAAAGEVNQERAHQHLGDGNRVSGERGARSEQRKGGRKQTDEAAEDQRRPDVDVDLAVGAGPGARRHDQRKDDGREPLPAHQVGEHPVGPLVQRLLVRVKDGIRSRVQ